MFMKGFIAAAGVWTVAMSAQAAPDLTVDISGAAQAYVGGTSQTYRVVVGNTGDASMPTVVTRVFLPPGIDLVTYTGGCTVRTGPSRLECTHFVHRAGFTRTISFTAAPPSSAGSWTFNAQVAGNRPESSTTNNVDPQPTQLVAGPAIALPVVPPIFMNAELCWDATQTVANCSPYGLDFTSLELLPGNQVDIGDPSSNTVWHQGPGQRDLQIASYDATNGSLLAEFNLIAVSASCFEGTVVYTNVGPDTYNARFCF
jgi:hypothetical protein